MGLLYRLEDYERYRAMVGGATYIDITRRTDPACAPQVWENLRMVVETYGAPWVVQLWTKNIAGSLRLGETMLRRLQDAGVTLTAQVTVTGLAGTAWEPHTPSDGLSLIPRLAALLGGTAHIKWRYDPIIPTVHDPLHFRALARQAAELGITRGVINFIAPPGRYTRVDRRLSALLPGWVDGMPGYDAAWQLDTARELTMIAQEVGLSLACCAESSHLAAQLQGLERAACGDYAWFAALSGRDPGRIVRRGSRAGCGCAPYFDVGSYGHWASCHRCAYCYAG